jgi:cytochrome c553
MSIAIASGANAADRAFGEYLSAECVACHQVSGRATGAIPPIVAWPDDQFVAVLKSYKKKERDNPVMQTIAARLSDEEMAALAAYFGSLPARSTRN